MVDSWLWCNAEAVAGNVADGWDDVCSATKGGCYNDPNGRKMCGAIEADLNVKSACTYYDGKVELTVPVEVF